MDEIQQLVDDNQKEAAKELRKLEKRGYKTLTAQIDAEFKISEQYLKPKFAEWEQRLKLYNNQRRDKEAIGDPLLFTVHQTILASLYIDRLNTEFLPNEEGDEETAENLNSMSEYDYQLMEKDILDYFWDWDATFFGRGYVLFNEFDRKLKCPVPENIDPLTFFRDPRGTSINGDLRNKGACRFAGRQIMLTKLDLKNGIYFNTGGLTKSRETLTDRIYAAQLARANTQGNQAQLNFSDLKGDNAEYLALEWLTHWNGKKVLVTLANDRRTVIRYKELKEDKWPIIDRTIYPISHDFDGVSVPDLIEDKQRARAAAQNLALKGIKAGLYPMYVFNKQLIKNPAQLKFEFNKFVQAEGDASQAIAEIPRQGVKSEVKWILDVLDQGAQRATATPEIQQGIQSDQKRTLGELNLVASRVDTRYSLSAKIFGWSEKRFWRRYYELYKRDFKDSIDEKVLRLVGAMGPKWRKLTKENITFAVDPDISVESKAIAEAKRIRDFQMFNGLTNTLIQDPSINRRELEKHYAKLSGLTKAQIEKIMPPTVDELQAERENDDLSDNKAKPVSVTEDHISHLAIHQRAADTPATYAHVEAHKRALMVKRDKPEIFPQPETTQQTGARTIPTPVQQLSRQSSAAQI